MSSATILLGAHISVSGGYYKAIERAEEIGCTTMQIFTKSNKAWFGKEITLEEKLLFEQTLKKSKLSKIMVHAAYLINLASHNQSVAKLSRDSLKKELERCEFLNIPYLVFHPGSHIGAGETKGLEEIAEGLNYIFEHTPGNTQILLETMAGAGTSLGHTFENLKTIYEKCTHPARLGICLDTCHVFAAGYDIATPKGYQEMFKHFDATLGLHLLKAIHLNDSLGIMGCKKDRHAKIGKGLIPLTTFELIMNDPLLHQIPKILETPVDSLEEYGAEIELLRGLVKRHK